MLLLKLPSVFRTLYFTPSTAAIMSLAVVLPTLPVTPHKGDREAVLVPGGQVPQGPLGVLYLNIKAVLPIALPLPLGETARRSPLQSGVDVGVAVKALPPPGG